MKLKDAVQIFDAVLSLCILVAGFYYLIVGNDIKAILYMVLFLTLRATGSRIQKWRD